MSLRDTINADVKEAMKAKNVVKRDALRLLTSAIKQIEVDERKVMNDDEVIKMLQKQIKQRNDSISQYKKAGRDDLVASEQAELDIYNDYMPKQLSDEELKVALKEIIESVGATSLKDMGKIMGAANASIGSSADGKRINVCVKEILR